VQNLEFSAEIINYRKDGSFFWNDLTITPILDTQGNLSNYITITRDITERKSAENQLHKLSLAVEQSPTT